MPNTAPARIRRHTKALKDAPMLPTSAAANSKYKPEYCALVVEWGKQGKSRIQCASLLNIDRGTLNNWERQFPDFQQALARAMAHSQDWWEEKARTSLNRKHFQAQLWRYSMAGRFKEDYADAGAKGLAEALPDFLAAITEAAEKRRLKGPGAAAKPIEPLDVVTIDAKPDRKD